MDYQTLIINSGSDDKELIVSALVREYSLSEFNFSDANPDFLTISREATISISDVKSLIGWASLKPFQSQIKVLLVMKADRMTTEAQNSMLKLIEEPPQGTVIALHTLNSQSLLPTISSRSRVINLSWKQDNISQIPEVVEQFMSKELGDKNQAIDRLLDSEPTREDLTLFLSQIYERLRLSNDIQHSKTRIDMLKSLKQALIGIRTGTNTRLTLESLAISMKEQT